MVVQNTLLASQEISKHNQKAFIFTILIMTKSLVWILTCIFYPDTKISKPIKEFLIEV